MPFHGLVYPMLFDVCEADLHGVVAIGFNGFDLGYDRGARLDNGNRNRSALLGKDLGHSDLFS